MDGHADHKDMSKSGPRMTPPTGETQKWATPEMLASRYRTRSWCPAHTRSGRTKIVREGYPFGTIGATPQAPSAGIPVSGRDPSTVPECSRHPRTPFPTAPIEGEAVSREERRGVDGHALPHGAEGGYPERRTQIPGRSLGLRGMPPLAGIKPGRRSFVLTERE